MRILQLTDFYPPVIGGLERHVAILGKELAARGHACSVATLARPGLPVSDFDGPIRVHRLRGWNRALERFYEDPTRNFHPTFPDPGVMRDLRRVIELEEPDIIHVMSWILYSALALPATQRSKVVVTLSDYGLVCAKKTLQYYERDDCSGPALSKCVGCTTAHIGAAKGFVLPIGLRLSRRLHHRVDRFIAISSAVARESAVGLDGVPTDIISTFVPDDVTNDVASCRPAFLPANDGYVLFVGALGGHKGLPQLIAATAGLDVDVVALGARRVDTPTDLPPRFFMTEDVPHEQVMSAWAGASIGVVPSVWPEPFGQVAIEAMACAKPVIASATGGLADIVVDGETGLLVPPGHVAALRAAIVSLLADPDRCAKMGAAGAARAPQFFAGAVTDRIERVFLELCS
ncbi:MAG: glycosyltransferase family 4 protein [Acidimicrobiia bacterium]